MLKKYCGASLTTEFSLPGNDKYQSLSGYYKGRSENIDTLLIEVRFYKENELIGNGTSKIMDNTNKWEIFDLTINYSLEKIPDRGIISISVNPEKGSHFLTTYCIDDLFLALPDSFKKQITDYLI